MQISGSLHILFHMLQSVFVVYNDMLIWAQRVVEWKKINMKKVSDSFDTCRRMCMLALEELERLAVYVFISFDGNGLEECGPVELSNRYYNFIYKTV